MAGKAWRCASMGPRSRDRGIASLCRHVPRRRRGFNGAAIARSRNYGPPHQWTLAASALQWGRDRAIAELRHRLPRKRQRSQLQWGRDRAIAEFSAGECGPSERSASMGPRSRDRGIAPPSGASVAVDRRFNGAAIARSRNCALRDPRRSDCVCFNGAAIARSRNSALRRRRAGRATMLQWGRDRAIAEFAPAALLDGQSDALQWGRDRAIAELAPPAWCYHRASPLQWGRDRAIAELLWPIHALVSAADRFNGAAIARSRNSGPGRVAMQISSTLQWGRDRAIAELSWRRLVRCDAKQASMGPRSRDRGIIRCTCD